jgi:hypothetical protein
MKLRPLHNIAVHLRTQKEYDEYIYAATEAGWVWWSGNNPAECRAWHYEQEKTCVRVEDPMEYCDVDYYKKKGYKILTLPELKKLLAEKPKKKPAKKQPKQTTLITDLSQLRHGMRVQCEIYGERVEDARISIDSEDCIAIVQNLKSGYCPCDTLGYKFSWRIWWPCSEVSFSAFLASVKVTNLVAIDDQCIENPKKDAKVKTYAKPEPWTVIYRRGDQELTADKIVTKEHPDGITPDELRKNVNRDRVLLEAHAKLFPTAK